MTRPQKPARGSLRRGALRRHWFPAFFAIALGLPAHAGLGRALDDCDELRGDEGILTGELVPAGGERWVKADLASKGDLDQSLTELDSDAEGALSYLTDLNHDGRAELLLSSPEGRLCGQGGCPFVLLDSRTLKRIGTFFGHLAILDERVNGYRIIQSYSRYRVDTSSLDTFAFDRGAYRLVSHALVDRCGLEQWHRRMRRQR